MPGNEERVWVTRGILGEETAWTMSKVKFRKRLGKRLLVIGLLFWAGVPIGFFNAIALICLLPGFLLPLAGLALYWGAKNAEDIGRARLQEGS